MKKHHNALALVALVCSLLVTPAYAQTAARTAAPSKAEEPPELRAAVILAPPFVMQQNGSLTGFNIDLWDAIAVRLRRKTRYQVEPNPAALEEAMQSKQADLVVTPVVITSARDEEFDFSLPILDAGLQIMVRET